MGKYQYFNRDVSWLGFNYRVLQEASNHGVPLYERLRFLSIFSSNLDEFFRVRYPALLAMNDLPVKGEPTDRPDENLLAGIRRMITTQQDEFGDILCNDLLPALQKEGVHLYYNKAVPAAQHAFITEFFYTRALSFLQPVILRDGQEKVQLNNNALYFFVELSEGTEQHYAVLNIPVGDLNRFLPLPESKGKQAIVFLDDVIRLNIGKAFPGYRVKGCYSIKMTRNADISLSDEWSDILEEQILQMIREREMGVPTRLLHEPGLSEVSKAFMADYFELNPQEMIEGSRYHNLKDLAGLPVPARDGAVLKYPPMPPLKHPQLEKKATLLDTVIAGDILLHLPYQSFNYILRFFNEAAIDPHVQEIYVTVYRVAAGSHILHALMSAARNGKKVTVFVELKARFDEANNLSWAQKMKGAGIRILYSIPGLKVHAKLGLVKRKKGRNTHYLALLSTGNFNENTARFYTDHILLTAHQGITREARSLFTYLLSRKHPGEYAHLRFGHLLVAGFNLKENLQTLIEREAAHQKAGKEARITIKINNLQEKNMIAQLYRASQAGVRIDLLVRGICCLVPGIPGMSEHIHVRRIVDRFLEHGRIFIFHNNGRPEVYMGSADLMDRNLHRRIETVFPVYEEKLKKEIMDLVAIQFRDNTQAVTLSRSGEMLPVRPAPKEPALRSQTAIYAFLRDYFNL